MHSDCEGIYTDSGVQLTVGACDEDWICAAEDLAC